MVPIVKSAFKKAVRLFILFVGLLVFVESLSFGVVITVNYIPFGKPYELGSVRYNPSTTFIRENIPRATENNRLADDPSDNRLIWFFGGSTTWSHTQEDARTLPSLVLQELNKNKERIRFSAVNFGMKAFNSLQEEGYLHQMLAGRNDRPDLVIFYDGANDAIYLSQCRDIRGHYGFRRIRALVESRPGGFLGLFRPLNAYIRASYMKELWDKLRQVAVPLQEESGLLAEYGKVLEKRYDYIHRVAWAHEARFLMFLQPIRYVSGPASTPEAAEGRSGPINRLAAMSMLSFNYQNVYRRIRNSLDGKPYFHDLSSCLDFGPRGAYQDDGIHLTDQGRQEVARAMSRIILEKAAAPARPKGIANPRPARPIPTPWTG